MRTVKWARKQLTRNNWAILDTETTGLYNGKIVENTIISNIGEPLLNTLIKPTIPIPAKAVSVHGITDDIVANVKTFPEIYPQIVEISRNNQILIYNANFDMGILNYCCKLHNLPKLKFNFTCLMLIAAVKVRLNVLVGLCLPIAQYFLPSFRELVGVKTGVSNFSAETHMQQEFDAPSLKKDSRKV